MRRTVVYLAACVALTACGASVWAADDEDPRDILIRQLKAQVTLQTKHIKRLRATIAELKATAAKNAKPTPTVRQEPTTAKSADPTGTIRYKGRIVNSAWIDRQYALFADKISKVDGRYYDIGRDVLREGWIPKTPPPIGSMRRPGEKGKIFQAFTKDEALVSSGPLGTWKTRTYYVRGVPPKININGTPFDAPLIYTGPYRYKSVGGTSQTVQGYMVYRPVMRDEFAEAIRSGLELVTWRVTTRMAPENRLISGGFNVQTATTMVEKKEYIATPVP